MKAIVLFACIILSVHLAAQPGDVKDSHMIQIMGDSYETLIHLVAETYKQKEDIAEFFYYWMAENIQYDYEIVESSMHSSGFIAKPDALEVFQSKKSICSGYAVLYKLFLNEFEIECEVVDGYAKSKEGLMMSDSLEIAHTWNVIKLDDNWSLVDVTWASTTRVQEKVSPFFFKTPPDIFVINHFPLIPYWQLVEHPISLDEFRRMPEVNAEYYELGFAALAPKLLREETQYKLIIGKSKRWKPIISKSMTGQNYTTIPFKRKEYGNYQVLTFPADETEPFILRLDAYQPIDLRQHATQTLLVYVVMR